MNIVKTRVLALAYVFAIYSPEPFIPLTWVLSEMLAVPHYSSLRLCALLNTYKGLSRVKYVRAQTVFPQSLLDEIQKYVQGEMVYIPKSPLNYMEWRARTGGKSLVARRNENIVQEFKTGASIPFLADSYGLSDETIKKIVI